MKSINKIARRLMLVFLALVASSTMFFSSPAVAATLTLLNSDNFETEVVKSDLPVVVDFGATWCGQCKYLAPIVEGIAKDYQGKIKVYAVDIDDDPRTTQKYGVRSVPSLVFFKDGSKQNQISGLTSREKILSTFGIS